MKIIQIWFLASLAIVGGCTSGPADLDVAEATGSLPQLDKVVFVDKDLQQTQVTKLFGMKLGSQKTYQISIVSTGSDGGETGFMRAWAVLQNHSDSPLALEARAVFLDKQGVIGENGMTAWQPLFLSAKGVGQFESLAGFARARHFIIELREGS